VLRRLLALNLEIAMVRERPGESPT
jgi:hypothetical protein